MSRKLLPLNCFVTKWSNVTQEPSWQSLPSDIPKPEDDGACNHLTGLSFPSLLLPSTAGNSIDPSTLSGLTILFCYPRTARPEETVPDAWNEIPGARGCTPQVCSFRDASRELLTLGVSHTFGCSTQDTAYQSELRERVDLPYHLISDEELKLISALRLPTFDWEGKKLIKRLTLAIEDGNIVKVWYPVFPPDESANEVLKWLKAYRGRANMSTQHEDAMIRNFQHRTGNTD